MTNNQRRDTTPGGKGRAGSFLARLQEPDRRLGSGGVFPGHVDSLSGLGAGMGLSGRTEKLGSLGSGMRLPGFMAADMKPGSLGAGMGIRRAIDSNQSSMASDLFQRRCPTEDDMLAKSRNENLLKKLEHELRVEMQLKMEIEMEQKLSSVRAQLEAQQVIEREIRLRAEMAVEANRKMQLERERMERDLIMSQRRMDRGFDEQYGLRMADRPQNFGMGNGLMGRDGGLGPGSGQLGRLDEQHRFEGFSASYDRRPFTSERQSFRDDRRPMMDDRRPMMDDRRPMIDDRRPMIDDRRSVRSGGNLDMARAMEEEEERGEPLPPIWDDAIGEGGKGRRHARDFNPEATALRKLILTV